MTDLFGAGLYHIPLRVSRYFIGAIFSGPGMLSGCGAPQTTDVCKQRNPSLRIFDPGLMYEMNLYRMLLICTCLTGMAFKPAFSKDTLSYIVYSPVNREWGIMTGIRYQGSFAVELGIARARSSYGRCGWSCFFTARSLSVQYDFLRKKTAVSLATWTSLAGLLVVGADVHSYTNLRSFSLGTQPFIGIGPGNWALCYGYRFRLWSRGETGLRGSSVSLRIHLPVFRH